MTPPLDLEKPYREGDPLDMDDARQASRRASQMRRDAERERIERGEKKAEAEVAYKKARATAILRLKIDQGATVAKELADGDDEVAPLLLEKIKADTLYDAAGERLKTLEGERSMLKSLIDWSSTIANVLRSAGGMRHEGEDPRADNRAGSL
jgi:hypothetical protein